MKSLSLPQRGCESYPPGYTGGLCLFGAYPHRPPVRGGEGERASGPLDYKLNNGDIVQILTTKQDGIPAGTG